MIERMSNLPTGVIGFKVNGTMHAEDYRDVMIPAVEEAAGAGEVRFLIVIPEFKGFTQARSGKTSRWASSTSAPGRRSGSSPTSSG